MGRAKVLSVLAGSRVDPLARGEVWVAPAVLESQGLPNDAAGVAHLAANLGADLCFVSCGGPQAVPNQPEALREAVAAVHARDLACGIVVDGPWQRLTQSHGLFQLLERLGRHAGQVEQEVAAQAALVHEELNAWAGAGADLVLLADDLAYSRGLYFSPVLFASLLLPHYRQFLLAATDLHVPLGFHSDGDLMPLLPTLVEMGFSFFSLETEAMNLADVQDQHKDRVALIAGIAAEWLSSDRLAGISVDDVSAGISRLARGGRLILGSACGLYDPDSPAALREIYRVADCLPRANARPVEES